LGEKTFIKESLIRVPRKLRPAMRMQECTPEKRSSNNPPSSGPDLALHISPPNSSCEESSSSRYVTEHVHGFDLWKQPQKFSNVASPAFENVGASTVLCLANPPPPAQENRYPGHHHFLPCPTYHDSARRLGETMMDHQRHSQQRVFPQAPPPPPHMSPAPPIPELSLGRLSEAVPLPRPDLPKLQNYHMVGREPGLRYSGYHEDVGHQIGMSGLLGDGYNAKHDGIYGSLAFRSRFPLKSPPKRSIRAPRMRWTTKLHAHFVQAVELLGGHESK
jgi:hypothetical protein